MNIALCSPNKNSFSETFIQAQRDGLSGEVFFYYGGELPSAFEGGLVMNSRKSRIADVIKGHYRMNRFSLEQKAVITSFKENNIKVVLAEYGGTGERILPICKELKLPLIVHFHGYDASGTTEIKRNNSYRGIFNYARFIVCVSKKMEKDLLSLGCPKEKLVYNVCGPREEFFNVKSLFNKQQFVFAGRFVNKKAPYNLILSFNEVVKIFPNARLIMAGEGPLRETCVNLARFYNLENNIEFPGVIDSSQFKDYLEHSLAYVQHSVTAKDGDSEGTPVAILEAGAASLPVISTRHAGIPDVVVEGETGWLVEEHDIKGFSNLMIKALGNPEKCRLMGENSRTRISRHFSLKQHLEKLNSLIEKSLHDYKH